jgi:nucleoside-diphosphate-sugar epimerase
MGLRPDAEGGVIETAFEGVPVLVTGATGFTGSLLVRQLVSSGARVRAITRHSRRTPELSGLPIEWFVGEVSDGALVTAAARDVQYVFHLAAAYRQARSTESTYYQVHVTSTKQLAQAVAGSTVLRRFVHVSTIGVHGHIDAPPADEKTPFDPDDGYQRTKAEAERWLKSFAAEHGVPVTILRPCAIYGPGDTRLLKLFRMAARGWFPMLGRGKGLYHLIHVQDLVDVMMIGAGHESAVGEEFIVGNPEATTLEDVARTVGRALGHRVRVIRLPVWPFFAAAAACEAVCRPFGLEPPLYRRRVAFYTKDPAFDTRKLREVLGYSVRYSNEEGISQTTRWYRAQGWL